MLLNVSLSFWKPLTFRSGENLEENCCRSENMTPHPKSPSPEVRRGEKKVNE